MYLNETIERQLELLPISDKFYILGWIDKTLNSRSLGNHENIEQDNKYELDNNKILG